MRSKRKIKCLIVILLCIIFTISELCLVEKKSDFFSADKGAIPQTSTQWIQQQHIEKQDVCTGEQIGNYDVVMILNMGFRVEKCSRILLAFLINVCIISEISRCSISHDWWKKNKITLHQSCENIIRYIHRQDGEKDS